MLRNIIIDLDMLLDTRLGTLRRMVPDQVDGIKDSVDYRFRDHERIWELGRIPKERWEAGWELRDEVTLSKSSGTLLLVDIPRFLADIENVTRGNNPLLSDIRFLINIYPYKLNEQTKKDLVDAIAESFSANCEIRTIRWDYSKLSPLDCRSKNIITAFIYDFEAYAKACFPDNGGWSTERMPTPNEDLTIITPRIRRDSLGLQQEVDEKGVELPTGVDEFIITKELFELIFNVQFISPNAVCELTTDARERIIKGSKNENIHSDTGDDPTHSIDFDWDCGDDDVFEIPEPKRQEE